MSLDALIMTPTTGLRILSLGGATLLMFLM